MTTNESYEQHFTLEAGPEAVFAALTSLDALSGWWAPASGDAVEGGELTFTFAPGSVAVMRVTTATPQERVVWAVIDCMMSDWIGTEIRFDLAPTSTGTDLHFQHAGLTPQLECFADCRSGWDHFVPISLRDFVESGVGHPVRSDKDLARRAAHERAGSSVPA